MMVLSRLWYVVLALLLGIATYVVFLAVGEYDRSNTVAMESELASDSQTVGWALTIDARKRLDALLIGVVDKGVQDSLGMASGKDTIPGKAKEDCRRSLTAILEKIPADYRPDALFAVDHDGRVVSQVGFDSANAFPDFELGGYPAVFDALHGFLRDDTWVLGGKVYRVAARPVEVDTTQPPLGAVVALRAVDQKFAQEMSKRTRANVVFFAQGARVATATVQGFDANKVTAVDSDLASLAGDKSFADGRSDLKLLGENGTLGVIYARLVGDAWELGGGFAVVRARTSIGGPLGFLNGADDKDKASVNILLIAAIVLGGFVIGIGLSFLEQTLPMREMEKQSEQLRKGGLDYLQLPKFKGRFRTIAQDVNQGIERVLEKGGGAARKPADLESILGPVPAQPAMSAFSFPLNEPGSGGRSNAFPVPASGPPSGPHPMSPAGIGVLPPASAPSGPSGGSAVSAATPPPIAAAAAAAAVMAHAPALPPPRPRVPSQGSLGASLGSGVTQPAPGPPPRPAAPAAGPPIPPPVTATAANRPPPGGRGLQVGHDDNDVDGDGPTMAQTAPSQALAGLPGGMPSPLGEPTLASAGVIKQAAVNLGMAAPAAGRKPEGGGVGKHTMLGMGLSGAAGGAAPKAPPPPPEPYKEDEATVIGKAPSEIIAQASGPNAAVNEEMAEWTTVFEDFVRTKKECKEPVEGLTFEKFQSTLRKNRDALVQRHNCKRVKFSVYVKEGRASLKATPVKE